MGDYLYKNDDNKKKEQTNHQHTPPPQDNRNTENNPLTSDSLLNSKRNRENVRGGEGEEKKDEPKEPKKDFIKKQKLFIKNKSIQEQNEQEKNKSINLNIVNVDDFAFFPKNNLQNIIELEEQEKVIRENEEKKRKEELLMKIDEILQKFKGIIDTGILDFNNIKDENTLKTNIRESIKTYIIQDYNIKKLDQMYHGLNPEDQASIDDRVKQLEEKLNEETYLKISNENENKNNNNKNIHTKKIMDSIELIKLKHLKKNCNEINPAINIKNIHKNAILNQTHNNTNTFNNNIYSNSVNIENKLKEFNNYSFKCLTQNLNFTMVKGTNEAVFKLTFENDGEFPWPKDKTFLSTDESKSNIKIQDILLDPVNPLCQYTFDIKFSNINYHPIGKYYCYLNFIADGKKFGNSILINVEIIENNKEKYKPIINVVRDEYFLDKNVASDTMIVFALEKTKTIEGAFEYIIEKKYN